MSFWALNLYGLLFCAVVMACTWLAAYRLNHFAIVDAVWAYCFAALAAFFAFAGEGWGPRRLALVAMVGAWSLRLGTHLARRLFLHHPEEDSRYRALKLEYGANYPFRFFLFFQMQAASVSVLALMYCFPARNAEAGFGVIEILGALVWLTGLFGEATADRQLAAFKHDPKNRGQVCEVGLWHYSRHPNYFFESLIWWGLFLFGLGSPGGIYGVYAPAIMLLLLLKVTGVPPAEAQSLQSRGDRYRAYQAKTSVFVPWWPKKGG